MGSNPAHELGNRALFPDLTVAAYLNHAAIAPASKPAVEAVQAVLTDYARFGVLAFGRWEQRRVELKQAFARMINAEADEIALGINTSRGVSDVALSIPWRSRDRVLLFSGEFPANVTPWQRAAELFGLEVVFQPAAGFEDGSGLQRLEDELKRGLRLVSLSAVEFQTGLRLPVAEIGALCRAHGAELAVDAIQACGAVPIDVRAQGIDYLVTGGHKWLLGFEGAGFTYARRECARSLRPYTAGWLSHEEAASFLFQGAGLLRYDRPLKAEAAVWETGTSSLLALAALGATVPLLTTIGVEKIWEHVNHYFDLLEPALVRRGFVSARSRLPEQRSTILSLKPPGTKAVAEWAAALRNRGVVIGTPDGYLRFSPHFANNASEVPLVLAAIDQALRDLG
ncbi:MAG TPA: aminotransferase class V-fold PLP-dependent enzyme [Polyangiaceae bacterium]|jgi:selenocysteine lyase/cysteine desulfurase|nr:aminotransferase class V-fold PLP-dependent enzyme [Polyangiaceae bacterium]